MLGFVNCSQRDKGHLPRHRAAFLCLPMSVRLWTRLVLWRVARHENMSRVYGIVGRDRCPRS